ncbi:MAG TPA: hypothetical protein VFF31_33335 [Blastocatellia bacterium]|jgi:hypothetical protein|nr:hypothetical protein [Blastocatellia bacterium]
MNRHTDDNLLAILREVRCLLARPENDFSWSGWNDETAALREIDALIAGIASGEIPELASLKVLFAPTGPIQELSASSGWGNEFLALADRFDAALSDIDTSSVDGDLLP